MTYSVEVVEHDGTTHKYFDVAQVDATDTRYLIITETDGEVNAHAHSIVKSFNTLLNKEEQ